LFDFIKKTIVVTGAARGIGKNIAAKFAASGATVIIIDRNAALLDKVRQELHTDGLKVETVELDLSMIDKFSEHVKSILKEYGSIDILVNNARAGKKTRPLSETLDNFNLSLDISLKAPLFFSQAVIEETAKRSDLNSDQNKCIINISSVVAQNICKESAAYHIAKAALENLTRYLAVHAGPLGFRVNAIRPGFIVQDEHKEKYESVDNEDYREMTERCHPLRRVGRSNDIANAAMFLGSDLASFITGQVLTVDGGLTIQDQWDLVHTYHHSLEK